MNKIAQIAACAGIFVALLATWHFTATYKDAVWSAKFDEYKREMAAQHAKNLSDALNQEREARERADKLEMQYHDADTEIRLLRADNGRLADELGGLRDPFAGGDGVCNTRDVAPTAPRNTANGAAPGELSKEATQFLLNLAEEADRAAAYARTCYEYVNGQ